MTAGTNMAVSDTMKLQLRSALEESGWSVQKVEFNHWDWWLNELSGLTSTWHPVGAKVYVAF